MLNKIKFHFSSFLLIVMLCAFNLYAHCDSMERPVVKAAKIALETRNINYVLIWVKAENEEEINHCSIK